MFRDGIFPSLDPHCKQTREGRVKEKGKGRGPHVPVPADEGLLTEAWAIGRCIVQDNSGDDGTTVNRVVFERQLLAVLFSEGQVERRDRPQGKARLLLLLWSLDLPCAYVFPGTIFRLGMLGTFELILLRSNTA